MPRFYFNIRNGIGFVEDEEGKELSGLAAARIEAINGARSIIAGEVLEGALDLSGTIEVTNKRGRILSTVTYREAACGAAAGP